MISMIKGNIMMMILSKRQQHIKFLLLLLLVVASVFANTASASSSSSSLLRTNGIPTIITKPTNRDGKTGFLHSHDMITTLRGGAVASSKRSSHVSIATSTKKSSSSRRTPTGSSPVVVATSKTTLGTGGTGGGTATIPNEIFNLVKSIVGAGVLGLPAGIAAFGNHPSALIPATLLIFATGLLSGFGFWLIGVTCAATGSNTYRQAWAKAVSPETSWIPTLGCLLVTSCAVTGYSMILSDTTPLLLDSFLGVTITRTQALLGVTTLYLLPLCLMKNLKSLSPFSLMGVAGVIYTLIAMAFRYLSGAYSSTNGGAAAAHLLPNVAASLQPKFGNKGASSIFHPNAFLLLSMLSTAYVSHYNAPRFYQELANNTIPRFSAVVVGSFALALVIFVGIASFGFLTFGEGSAGFILNNYAKNDTWMSWSRLAVAFSILFSYPLAFVGVRDGVLDLLQVPKEKRTDKFLNVVTVSLLAGVTSIAYVTTDLRFIMALSGSTWGNAITYLFPTFMIISLALRKKHVNNPLPWVRSSPIVAAAGTTAVLGLIMGVVGLSRALSTL